MIILALVSWLFAASATDTFRQEFIVTAPSEAVATVRARCARCAWGESGREAAALRISVDGKYSQHVLLARGDAVSEYPVTLGAFAPGRHTLAIDRDPALSAKGAGPATIERVDITILSRDGSDDWIAQSMAPILHARPNTVGKFTDLPILAWYEIVRTDRGRQFRYSIIFTNEDGGTATDRLMATWGRTTDIEFVYGVEVDAAGRVLAEEFQGPGHEVPTFKGRHEAASPVELRHRGAGNAARRKDRRQRRAEIGKDPGSAAVRLCRGMLRSGERRRRVLGPRNGKRRAALVRFRSRYRGLPHRADGLFQRRRPGAGRCSGPRRDPLPRVPTAAADRPPSCAAGIGQDHARESHIHARRRLPAATVHVLVDRIARLAARRRVARDQVGGRRC